MSRRPYVREASRTWWWLAQPRYVRYMVREVTCLFIGGYAAILIVGIVRLSQGQAAYEGFLDAVQGPASLAFHGLAFLFALYHTTTWFNVTPKAMPLRVGGWRVPGGAIVGAHYAGWLAVSAVVLFLAGG